MNRFLTFAFLGLPLFAADGDVVFRSDVSLARVDVRVLDRDNRAIAGLTREDFLLKVAGQIREIRNFSSEDMPIDVLFLLDVSGSMRPHVERIAAASRDALRVMNEKDRVAIMVFDTYARVRSPFRSSLSDVDREFQSLLRDERFNGGTAITRSLVQAAAYIGKNGRKDARRAIVILTDDQTGGQRDEPSVNRALTNAQTVLMALIAPDAMFNPRFPGSGRGGHGGGGGSGWPGSGGGIGGGPLGGIILGGPLGGGRGQRGGGQQPGGQGGPVGGGPVWGASRTHPAGTSEIARQSGGDSLPVDDASALEDTLNRIRQRYTLYFHFPAEVKPGEERTLDVMLSANARRRTSDAEVRFRRVYIAPGESGDVQYSPADDRPVTKRQPGQVAPPTSAPAATDPQDTDSTVARRSAGQGARRKTAISEPDGPHGVNPSVGADAPIDSPPSKTSPAATPSSTQSGGWRTLKPGEKP